MCLAAAAGVGPGGRQTDTTASNNTHRAALSSVTRVRTAPHPAPATLREPTPPLIPPPSPAPTATPQLSCAAATLSVGLTAALAAATSPVPSPRQGAGKATPTVTSSVQGGAFLHLLHAKMLQRRDPGGCAPVPRDLGVQQSPATASPDAGHPLGAAPPPAAPAGTYAPATATAAATYPETYPSAAVAAAAAAVISTAPATPAPAPRVTSDPVPTMSPAASAAAEGAAAGAAPVSAVPPVTCAAATAGPSVVSQYFAAVAGDRHAPPSQTPSAQATTPPRSSLAGSNQPPAHTFLHRRSAPHATHPSPAAHPHDTPPRPSPSMHSPNETNNSSPDPQLSSATRPQQVPPGPQHHPAPLPPTDPPTWLASIAELGAGLVTAEIPLVILPPQPPVQAAALGSPGHTPPGLAPTLAAERDTLPASFGAEGASGLKLRPQPRARAVASRAGAPANVAGAAAKRPRSRGPPAAAAVEPGLAGVPAAPQTCTASGPDAPPAQACPGAAAAAAAAATAAAAAAAASTSPDARVRTGAVPIPQTFGPGGGVELDMRVSVWEPPASPYGLIEELLFQDPWKLLLACVLLNRTSGVQVRKVLWPLLRRYPSPAQLVAADTEVLEGLLRPLGLFRKRAQSLRRFSREYAHTQWTCPKQLHGIGQYAADAYNMFCRGQWQGPAPADKDLRRYHEWLVSTGGLGSGLQRESMAEL
ncbi:MAG: hypothetical protein WDW36_008956 [Sanguina aurantia]